MNKPIQCVTLPDHDQSEFVVLATKDDAEKYLGKGYVDVLMFPDDKLWQALESAEAVLLDTDLSVIMDDINKFTCTRSCHMERGAFMKYFLMKCWKLNNKLYMRSDEQLTSLNEMIDKIFQK